MKIVRLDIEGLRCIAQARVLPREGVLFFAGPNGAGKTTVLEALHLLGYGRSFRAGMRDAVIRRGATESVVFAEVDRDTFGRHRLGLRRGASDWMARVDEQEVVSLVDLFRHCPAVCFEPGSHALIAGSSDERRAYLDWSVFHVEPDFLQAWRRHARALKQRNAGLKAGWGDASLLPWEIELAESSLVVARCRERVMAGLAMPAASMANLFLPELGDLRLAAQAGFGDRSFETAADIGAIYAEHRESDRDRGYTRLGVQRGDWSLSFQGAPRREHLSRGQEKLAALVMVLAQVEHFRAAKCEWPLLLLDDLASELDAEHLGRVLDWIFAAGIQTWMTGTAVPEQLRDRSESWSLFHVEQGLITAA